MSENLPPESPANPPEGWWQAYDGKWYPPTVKPTAVNPTPGNPNQFQPAPSYQYQSTNGFAIASMVLGIVWVYWIGSILALVFGYVAQKQIRENNQRGNGMAIAGIVLGWVGVASLIVVIIVAIVASGSSMNDATY